ncbi:tripartite tricarboxylate transporter permease [Candidatus Woesearchaeota archaeon]|nr:tripartite tricarboxylate transporter permease [Candidatus Woesearchaeota archaeon]
MAIALGTLAGIFTGLIPGIHVNLVSTILLGLSGFLLKYVPLYSLLVFIVSMAITHTFIDTIPSIFLGAPDGATALSVLPGHRLLLEGEGLKAVMLTVVGSLFGLLLSLILYFVFEQIIGFVYPLIKNFIGYILIFFGFFMIYKSENKFRALVLFAFSGYLGFIVLNSNTQNSLFPLLSGFFGISTLLFSLNSKSKIPLQNKDFNIKLNKSSFVSIFLGVFSGFFTAFFPGLGASTAAAVSSTIREDSEPKNFLLMIGAISTVNFFMSLAALSVLGKARNGAIIAVMTLQEIPNIFLLIIACVLAGGLSVLIAIRVSKKFLLVMEKINYELVVKFVIVFLFVICYILSGFTGIIILIISSAIGYYANWKGIPRNIMMACILVPVISFFLF